MRRLALAVLTMAIVAPCALAIQVVVEPPEAHLVSGAQQAFTATALNSNGDTIIVEQWEWDVHPPRIGSINDDGLFTAGNTHGHGMVSAAFYLDSVRYVGRAHVSVEDARYFVIVRPRDVFLTPGETVQYEAWVVTNSGDSIGGLTYEWEVEPDWLGNVTEVGLFTAGNQAGRGSVIARTTYEQTPLMGAGFVAISEAGWGDIAGTVTDEESAPISHACVALFIPPHRDPIRTVLTGDDGNYLFQFLYPGSYWVRADARRYLPEFYDDSPGIEGATPVSVVSGSITEGIDFDLALAGVISGRVTADNSPDPLRHAYVAAFGIWPRPFHFLAAVDEQGDYVLGGLPPGTYVVRADACGFAQEFWQEAAVPEEATPVVIDVGSVVDGIDFTLEPIMPPFEGQLSGLVTDDSTGIPIEDAHVILFREGPGPMMMFHQRTDSLGGFSFERLPYGHYIVLCGARGYLHEYYDNVPFWRQATVLNVNENSSPEIAIALSPRMNGGLCGFTGVIHDGSGNPLEGVLVRAEGSVTASAETGPDGRYYLAVAEGEYILTADRTSLATRYYPNASDPSQATILTVDPATPEVEADFTLDVTLDADEAPAVVPQKFGVSAIYPNPFNATTRISYEVPSASKVKLAVYDVLGREVAVLVDGMQTAGTQNVTFNGANLASGVYFVRLSGTWGASTHKMLLLK